MKKNRLVAKVTRQDVADACEDGYGVLYSKDGKRLLKCNNKVLAVGGKPSVVKVPDYITTIGNGSWSTYVSVFAFPGCERLSTLEMPYRLVSERNIQIWGCGNKWHSDDFTIRIVCPPGSDKDAIMQEIACTRHLSRYGDHIVPVDD